MGFVMSYSMKTVTILQQLAKNGEICVGGLSLGKGLKNTTANTAMSPDK